jgi:hypothetical protein
MSPYIEHPHRKHSPNAPITLFDGQLGIRQGRSALQGKGRIRLVWLPYPRVQFEVTLVGASVVADMRRGVGVTWGGNRANGQLTSVSHTSSRTRG